MEAVTYTEEFLHIVKTDLNLNFHGMMGMDSSA